MRRVGFLLLLAGLVRVAAAGQAVNQTPARTGLIVGQVVDASTNQPVPDVIVTLTTPFVSSNLPTTPRGRVLTDAEGYFFFADLPAPPIGARNAGYAINASKAGYVDSFYGARRPGGGLVYFDLAEGERSGAAKILMWKYGAIGGTIVDEAGEPMVGVTVRAFTRASTTGSARTIGVPVGSGLPATTDDRGIYRISTLVPGDYVVVVPSTQTTFPAAVLAAAFPDSGRSAATAEMSAASPELSRLGSPRNQQIGDLVLMTLNRTAIPPAPDASGRLSVYQTTFYPSGLAASDATTISLKSGEERNGVDFELKALRAVRVSGTLTGPNGPSGMTALRLVPVTAGEYASESGFETVTGLTDARGAFTLLGVPAGQYVLRVNKRSVNTAADTLPSGVDPSVLWASVPLVVGDSDVTDLRVNLQGLIRVTGRLQFDGQQPAPPVKEIEGLIVRLATAGSGSVAISTQLDAKAAFAIGVPGGAYSVRPDLPAGWHVKSVSLGDRDILDGPLEIRPGGLPEIVITCTSVAAQLSGTVTNVQGTPDSAATVLVFPVDRRLWPGGGSVIRLRTARANRTGRYVVSDLPPGDYFAAAMDDGRLENWQDPKSLEAISRSATRMTITAGENRTLDLRRQ
ncbi:MAG TPA: carboxypeptidase-like regulatory domain-containing protein [Vicinamibacterales bacterium]|nr:carboxypeptidase-like regulatory domain-containing protein [Vicinamibacterales bacterium]